MKEITEEEFDAECKLIDNHLDNNAPFDGKMYETYGDALEFVMKMAEQNRVITIIEGDTDEMDDDGEIKTAMFYASGLHFVNRIGYLVTLEPIKYDFQVQID